MAFANFRGVFIKGCKNALEKAEIVELVNSTHFCVPLKLGQGSESNPLVKVGDNLKAGSVIASPVDKTSAFIYSPVSGNIVDIFNGLNAFGQTCKIVKIEAAHIDSFLYFNPLTEMSQSNLLGRLVESGSMDTWGRRLPSYFKYVNDGSKAIKTLIVKLFDSDGYVLSNALLTKNFSEEVAVGASLFYKVAGAKTLIFAYTKPQTVIIEKIKEKMAGQGIFNDDIKYVKVPDIYPVDYDNLLVYQLTKKVVKIGEGVEVAGYAIENAQTCYNFYRAAISNEPTIQTLYTLSGSNFAEPVFAFVKNGLAANILMDKAKPSNDVSFESFVVGGALCGVSQCEKQIGLPISASSLHSFNPKNCSNKEIACINCGKCNRVCPVSLLPVMLDNYALDKDFGRAKRYGAEACIECGLCSYICPTKRYLTQRIGDMKKSISEGRTM